MLVSAFRTEVLVFPPTVANPLLVSFPKVTLQSGLRPRRSVSVLSEEITARFPSVVGPFPVLLPEGCFPGSVSARWYQAEAFYLAVCCSRSCPEELLLLLLPTDCTVVGTSATEVAALPVPHFPKVLWPSFTEVPDRPVGKGTYQTRKLSLSLIASLALSPRFVTNTLLGLSRPVGKGPGRLPKRSSTTP